MLECAGEQWPSAQWERKRGTIECTVREHEEAEESRASGRNAVGG